MPIGNEPDVEHVQPKSRQGNPLDWDNLLLSCKKCNKIKNAKNPDRVNYLWPDEDNTIIAFSYYNEIMVSPAPYLSDHVRQLAQNTIELVGIDRVPGKINNPTQKDKMDLRWIKRRKAWDYANRSLVNWQNNPSSELRTQIGLTAEASGFYAIWLMVFSGHPLMITEIKSRFKGTYEPLIDDNNQIIRRPNGRF
jgi:hypothetical protein